MPTYRIDLRYDGTGFVGYARQPGARTVQSEVEEALFHHTGEVGTVVAGRTDAGVHAHGQVVSFAVDRTLDTAKVARSLNKQLGAEIVVVDLTEALEGFDARFRATARSYRYLIQNGGAPDPALRLYAWHVRNELSVDAMNSTVAPLCGTHDFASFCRPAPGRRTERTVRSAQWTRESQGLVRFDITASSFCHQMVRSIVDLCVHVGLGKARSDVMPGILAAKDRNAGRGAAPAHGLTLMSVSYPGDG